MKTNKIIRKSATVMTVFAALSALPQYAMASTDMVNATGVSDETLFTVLSLFAAFQLLAIIVIANVIKSIASNKEIWQNRWNKTASAIATLVMVGMAGSAFAQDAHTYDSLINMNDTAFISLVMLNLFLFGAFIYLVVKLNGLFNMLVVDADGKKPATFWSRFNRSLTDAVPIEHEEDVMTDHEYDGIKELDNNLPPWWLYGFYFTILNAIIYIAYYFFGSGLLQAEEYAAEMADAEKARTEFVATQGGEAVDENNVALLTEASAIANGQKTFKLNCSPCHGETGGSMPGGVGPNLTDDYWLHGGTVTDIFRTIKYGVPAKGMVPWEAQLSNTKIQEVASYIKSLKGSNPANAKEPQGDLFTEETSDSAAPAEEAADSNAVAEPAQGDVTVND